MFDRPTSTTWNPWFSATFRLAVSGVLLRVDAGTWASLHGFDSAFSRAAAQDGVLRFVAPIEIDAVMAQAASALIFSADRVRAGKGWWC